MMLYTQHIFQLLCKITFQEDFHAGYFALSCISKKYRASNPSSWLRKTAKANKEHFRLNNEY